MLKRGKFGPSHTRHQTPGITQQKTKSIVEKTSKFEEAWEIKTLFNANSDRKEIFFYNNHLILLRAAAFRCSGLSALAEP